MKRNSDLRNTWSSCAMQMLKRQTRVKGLNIVLCTKSVKIRDQNVVYLSKNNLLNLRMFAANEKVFKLFF